MFFISNASNLFYKPLQNSNVFSSNVKTYFFVEQPTTTGPLPTTTQPYTSSPG